MSETVTSNPNRPSFDDQTAAETRRVAGQFMAGDEAYTYSMLRRVHDVLQDDKPRYAGSATVLSALAAGVGQESMLRTGAMTVLEDAGTLTGDQMDQFASYVNGISSALDNKHVTVAEAGEHMNGAIRALDDREDPANTALVMAMSAYAAGVCRDDEAVGRYFQTQLDQLVAAETV